MADDTATAKALKMDISNESIAARSLRLNQLFYGKAKCDTMKNLLTRDSLIDALFALYDECNNEEMRKDKYIASFVEKFCSAIAELRQLQVNIHDFEVKKIIGQGHFGEVQVVREKATGNVYAMKVLRKSDTLSQQSAAFYEEERDIMAKSCSPWITKLQYAFQDKVNLYLVMEFHPGGDMLSLLEHNNNQLSEDIAQFYLAEIVLAVHSLHNMGYVHRDIKPDNILIDRMGHIKLADFGSAAKLSAQKTVVSRMPVGTPDYIAPEVLMAMNGGPASSGQYGEECDWWSLGIVAYEMLYGCTPFSDDKVLVTYSNIMNFKKSLKFPEDVEVSEAATELIRGLLQECSTRWGYQEIYTTKFFFDIDWDKIHELAPPFVPTVSGEDDTSNFDEFEHKVARPTGSNLRPRKEFNGRNLPFIGFTYTLYRNAVSDRICVSLDNSSLSLNINPTEESKKQAQKIFDLEEEKMQLKERISLLEGKIGQKESSFKRAEAEMNSLSASTAELASEVLCLKRVLSVERKDRATTEEKALEIMRTIKENFQKRESALTAHFKSKIENETTKRNELKKKLQEVQKEVEKKTKELNEISEELSQSKKKLVEYHTKITKQQDVNGGIEAEIHDQIQLFNSNTSSLMRHLQQKLEKSANSKTQLEKELESTKKVVADLQKEIVILKKEKAEVQLQANNLKNTVTKLESNLHKVELQTAAKVANANSEDSVSKAFKDLEEKHMNLVGKYEEVDKQTQKLKNELAEKGEEKHELLKEINRLKTKLSDKCQECDKLELNLNALKPTCMELEDQLHRLEILIEAHQEKEATLEKQRDSLKMDIEGLEEDIRNSQELLAKEKRNRVENELKVGEMEDEIQSLKVLHEAEVKTLHEQLAQQRKASKDFSDQALQSEKKLTSVEATVKLLNETIAGLQNENVQIKEEAARYITQISSLKASNLKLTHGLEEAMVNYEEIKDAYQQICDDMDGCQISFDNEKIKFQQTISQQTKLIDFLQTKNEAMERKYKGTHFRFFTAKKENINPLAPHNKDFANKLDKDHSKTRHLRERIRAIEAENIHRSKAGTEQPNKMSASNICLVPTSPSSRAVLSVLAQSSPNTSKQDVTSSPLSVAGETANNIKKPQGERMRHNIPHRFQDKLCMHARKCAACLCTIHFGFHALRCQECEVTCHPKCATSLPNTCGLPSAYVEHFVSSLHKEDKPDSHKSTKATDQEFVDKWKLEGWVKIPRKGKQGWEKSYACIHGTSLYIFEKDSEVNSPSSAQIQIELCPSDGTMLFNHAVTASELPSTANSDLPYILKLEHKPQTTCLPPKCHYIMMHSFADKQQWVSVLEKIIEGNGQMDCSLESKLLECCVLKHKRASLEINSICIFSDESALIGAKQGLFVMDLFSLPTNSIKAKIEGIQEVYQISVLNELNLVVFIRGEQRELWMADLEDVKEWVDGQNLDEPLQQSIVADLDCCHLFAVSDTSNIESIYMCVANEETMYLLKWSKKQDSFQKIKEMKLPQTCSCIHFRKSSVIIGADKFYKLDLNSYTLENFLDTSDTSLAFLAYAASELKSYPISIFKVSHSGNTEEYLLCYNEEGIFVDGNGRRSREQGIEWAKIPMGFGYHVPYLFVMHFNTIEVIHILSSNVVQNFLPLANPQYLGKGVERGTVYVSTHDTVEMKVLYLGGDIMDTLPTKNALSTLNLDNQRDGDEVSEAGTEFTFTTSVLQSLDEVSIDNVSVISSNADTEDASA